MLSRQLGDQVHSGLEFGFQSRQALEDSI
jgi:hypothetical protein